eukprot:TRINITY_DN16914_c0_g1_i1.p1 TRINITY_DN16914_c0_g1~~TRINITY_DN16914_c0_g1_i1.p1  ORF type:complete len:383 (+),score=60.94 TRINITY_DN16914_c0_g1_i1:46-1149(+)
MYRLRAVYLRSKPKHVCVRRQCTSLVPPKIQTVDIASGNFTHHSVQKVNECFQEGQYQEAVDILDEILLKHRKNLLALYQKGMALMGLDRLTEAILCFDAILEVASDSRTLIAKGEALQRLDYPLDALECFDKVKEVCTTKIKALDGNDQEDKNTFTEDIALAHAHIGTLWMQLGDYHESKENFLKAFSTSRAFPGNFWLRYAECLQHLQEPYESILKAFDEAISSEPSPESFLSKVEFLMLQGQHQGAMDCLEEYKYSESYEGNEWYYGLYKGIVHWHKGEIARSLEEFNATENMESFELLPAESKAALYHNRGKALASLCDFENAEKEVRRALANDFCEEHRNLLEDILSKSSKTTKSWESPADE